jgi:L-fuculose-phosphate aldolase
MPRFIRNVFDRRKDVMYILLSRQPYTRALAFTNMPLKPHLDDMAQIVGTFAGCIEDMTAICQNEPGSRNAVFVKCDGALCLGRDAADAAAVQMVLEKASRSHIESTVLGGGYVIPWIERFAMRLIYKKKYSRIGRKG